MNEQRPTAVDHFLGEGLITDVVRVVKSGKEASVHLCRADPTISGEPFVALKLYHPLDRRDFRDESVYRDGEWIKERRVRVALARRTRFGREVRSAIWVHREWEALRLLHEAGAPVPRPIALGPDAILMSFVGDQELAAPQLRSIRPGPGDARDLFEQVIRAIELMLYRDVVHGDLSAYNLLVWEGRVTVIDLPQAVDAKKNRFARGLLQRDVRRVCEYFARYAVAADADRITDDLWTAWELAELVPEELRAELRLDL
ncbi:MAG TPA: RIO1 family regulatory kinase/ATPase [Actinomycetota bacterium]|nr:RIO1 family regulatory kinase/ATPase [Actinomycetota bacterium]